MEFNGRASQPQPAASSAQFGAAPATTGGSKRNTKRRSSALQLWAGGLLGLVIVLLVAALVVAIGFGGPKSEGSYVDTSKLQAVFLNTGQVYFGNLKSVNTKYFVLDNIYYLQTSGSSTSSTTSSSSTSVTLVKLGCELHAPYDQMIINRDQVTFWENLQSNGQVATAVATFQKDNPDGQKCSDQSAASSGSSTSVQGSNTTTNTGTTSTTGTTDTTTK